MLNLKIDMENINKENRANKTMMNVLRVQKTLSIKYE